MYFHLLRLIAISRHIGSLSVRGQYKTLRSREGFTKAQRTAFDKKYPKEQMFTKVELAKYINAYQEVVGGYNKIIIGPNSVVRGNEKNYAKFINNNLPDVKKINNVYFEDAVAKAILFKTAERRYGTRKNDYCIGGLRQVAVPYTISLISYLTNNKLDLYKIWKNQCLSDALSDFIYDLMKQVNAFIIDNSPITHYIEWAKKDECWDLVKQHEWNFNIEEIKSDLIDEKNPLKRKSSLMMKVRKTRKSTKKNFSEVFLLLCGKKLENGAETRLFRPH